MAEAKVVITGDSSGAQKALGGVSKKSSDFKDSLKKAGKSMSKIGGSMTKMVTGPIVALGTGIFSLAVKTGNYADSVLDLNAATGLSTESIQKYQAIAQRAGTNTDAFTNAAQRLTAQMARGAEGSADLRVAAEQLGLSFEEIKEASPDDRMRMLMQALSDVEDEGQRATLGTRLLRGSYEELAPILAMTEEEMGKVVKQATETGKIMDGGALKGANDFRMSLDELKQEFTGLFRTIATDLMPVLNGLMPIVKESLVPAIRNFAENIGRLTNWFSNLEAETQKMIIKITAFVAALGPTLLILGKITIAVGALVPVLVKLGTYIISTLIPAIAGISAPVWITIGAVAAFIAIGTQVYRHWEQVSNSLSATWELIKASVVSLVSSVRLNFTRMKATILEIVDDIVDKLSVLEKLPFGVGEKFAGLADVVGDSAEKARADVDRLAEEAETNGQRVGNAMSGAGEAFSELGSAIGEDVKAVVSRMKLMASGTGKELDHQTEIVEEEQKEQSTVTLNENDYRVEVTEEAEEKQTEITEEEAEKRTDLKEKLEKRWNDKLFKLTADRLEQLDAELKAELANAEELGANKTDIVEYYAIKRQEILDKELEDEEKREKKRVQKLEKFQKEWSDTLFKATADNLELLENEKNQAIAKAEELGADKTDILAYYAIKEQKIIDQRNKETEKKRKKENKAEKAAAKEKEKIRTDYEQSWTDKLFKQTATRSQILEKEKQEAIKKAEKLGSDTTAIIEYYAKEQQKIRDKSLKQKEEIAKQEEKILQSTAESWANSYINIVDSVVSGNKTIKEALKDALIAFVTSLQKQVLAVQIAEQAKALMMAPLSFGATLAAIPSILAATAPAMIGFEAVKAGIRGLAEGGNLLSSGSVLVGERGPELLNLPRGARVTPLEHPSINSRAINITITGNKIDSSMDINRIGDQLVRKIRRAGVAI